MTNASLAPKLSKSQSNKSQLKPCHGKRVMHMSTKVSKVSASSVSASHHLGACLPGAAAGAAAPCHHALRSSARLRKQEAAGGSHMEAAALGCIAALCEYEGHGTWWGDARQLCCVCTIPCSGKLLQLSCRRQSATSFAHVSPWQQAAYVLTAGNDATGEPGQTVPALGAVQVGRPAATLEECAIQNRQKKSQQQARGKPGVHRLQASSSSGDRPA